MQKAGLHPKLQLGRKTNKGVVSTGKHTVKVLSDKIVRRSPTEEGDDGLRMRYVVEEDGVEKQYDTRLKERGGDQPSYFVQAMSEIEPGEIITLEMKKAGIKNYIEIVRLSLGEVSEAPTDDDEEEGVDIE